MTNPDNDVRPRDDLEPEDHLEAGERDPEASPEDVSEQVSLADPAVALENEPVRVRDDVNEWDAVEQARIVTRDEDYR